MSKIATIYDNIKYDCQFNADIAPISDPGAQTLFRNAQYLAHIVVAQEYGMESEEKTQIASEISVNLIRKILLDMVIASGVPTEVYGWDHNRQEAARNLHYPSAAQCGFRAGQLLHLSTQRRGELPDPRAEPGACIKCNPLPSPTVVAAALAVLAMAPLGRIDLSALVAYTVLIRNSGMVSSGLAVPLMQLVSRGDTQAVWMHLLHCVAQCSGRDLACRCCLGLYGKVELGEQREYVAFLRKYLDDGDMALRLASDFKDGPSRASAAEAVRDAGYIEAYHRLTGTSEEPWR